MNEKIKLKIGDLSRLLQVSVRTLRYYEEIGLLKPCEVDDWTGYRYYHIDQMQTVGMIRSFKEAGFALDEIRELIEDGNLIPETELLKKKIEECDKQMERLNARKQRLQLMIDRERRINTMSRFSIQSLPAQTVASHRAILQSYDEIEGLFHNVINPELEKIGCVRIPNNCTFTIFHDEEYVPSHIDVEFCQEVVKAGQDTNIIHFKQMPAIPMALCMAIWGNHESMLEAYRELYDYMEQNGYEVDGKLRFCSVNGSWNTNDSSKWLSIIQQPVKRVKSEE